MQRKSVGLTSEKVQQVQVGTALLEMESAEMLKDISDLAARTSDLSIREAELRNRRATISTLLPLAERHPRLPGLTA
jgi:hypothetical protein